MRKLISCIRKYLLSHFARDSTSEISDTVKLELVVTSVKQTTCIKQAYIQHPKQAIALKCMCIKQAPVFSKHILIIP